MGGWCVWILGAWAWRRSSPIPLDRDAVQVPAGLRAARSPDAMPYACDTCDIYTWRHGTSTDDCGQRRRVLQDCRPACVVMAQGPVGLLPDLCRYGSGPGLCSYQSVTQGPGGLLPGLCSYGPGPGGAAARLYTGLCSHGPGLGRAAARSM